jgi:hypothetical protein
MFFYAQINQQIDHYTMWLACYCVGLGLILSCDDRVYG